MTKPRTLLAASAAMLLILAAGCGSGGILGGDNGNNGNYPSNYPSGTYNSTLHGTVDSVDLNGHSVYLVNTSGYGMLSGNNNGSMRVYYDANTPVSYNGQTYRPDNLERGDQVDVQVTQNGNQLIAQSMTVTYNSASSNQYPSNSYPNQYPSSQYPNNGSSQYSTVRGTVQYVDTSARTITLNSTSWRTGYMPGYGNTSSITVRYDAGLNLNVNGRMDSISGLERGDVVDVQVRDLGNPNLLAQSISLVRDVRQ